MSKPEIKITLPKEIYRPGESVDGTIDVEKGGTCDDLQVRLINEEVTKSRETTYYVTELAGYDLKVEHSGPLVQGQSIPFSTRLPSDAKPTVKSEHGRLAWAIAVRVTREGRDEVERGKFRVDS